MYDHYVTGCKTHHKPYWIIGKNITMLMNTNIQTFHGHDTDHLYYRIPSVKNWRILLKQSFTANMPLLPYTHPFTHTHTPV